MTYTFHYGAFAHPSCEVYPRRVSVKPLRSRDNVQWANLHRIEIAGDLVNCNTPAEVVAAMDLLQTAYSEDFKDAGFKLDGAWTSHYLETDAALNLSGNRIIYRSWDNVLPSELANTRSFSIGIEAVFATTASAVIEYSESTVKRGTGGPTWRLYNLASGIPVKEEITENSKVTHITTGRFTTMQPWTALPAPYWPLEEHESLRVVNYSNPIWHGHPSGKTSHYTVDYKYFFERLGPDATTPFNTWFP
jgi:hypothetical protein